MIFFYHHGQYAEGVRGMLNDKMDRRTLAVLLGALIFYLFLAWAVPYSSTDDLQWGLEQGVRWWRYGLLNGRYAGNLCAVLMCHFPLVKVLLMGGGMFSIPLLMAVLMSPVPSEEGQKRFLPLFLFCSCAVLLMPPVIWTELYGWVSGFGNYGVSAALFLSFLLLVRETRRRRNHLGWRAAALFALALVMGLFVETQAVLFVGVALVLGIYAALWDRPMCLPYWAGFAGAALAVGVVFSNGVASELMETGEALHGLRHLTFTLEDGLLAAGVDVLRWYFQRLLPIAFLRGAHLAVYMAIITALGFWNSRARPLAILGAVPLVTFYLCWSGGEYLPWAALGCLSWGLTFAALAARRCALELKIRRLLLFLTAPLALLPLAATTTLGHRFYFLPMLVLIMLAADLAAPLLTVRPGTWAVGLALAGTVALTGHRAAVTGGCNRIWDQEIRRATAENAEVLVLPTDRYERVFYSPRNPWDAESASYFRQFYGVSDHVTLVFLPEGSYETWPGYTREQWDRRVELPPSDDFVPSLP